MKKITIHNNRVPLMASATDGVNAGEIVISSKTLFIQEMVDEFEGGFEAIRLKKMLLAAEKHIPHNKITIKEKDVK